MNASAAVAAADGAAGSSSAPPAVTWSAVVANNQKASCGLSEKSPCYAAYDEDSAAGNPLVKLLVRTPSGGYYNQDGIYACKYYTESSKTVVTAPAKLVAAGVQERSGTVACPHPLQDPKNTKKAAWSSTVSLLEGGLEVPRVDMKGAVVADRPTVWFGSHGPVIGGIGDTIQLAPTDLVKGKAFVTFTVDDRDSDLSDVEVSAEATKDDWVTGVAFEDRDGNMHTMIISLDVDYTGDLEAEITIAAKDNHDSIRKHTFKFSLNNPFAGFWASQGQNWDVAGVNHWDVLGAGAAWKVAAEGTTGYGDGTWQEGDKGFDTDTGEYTVQSDGIYLLSGSFRVDGADGNYIYMAADINNEVYDLNSRGDSYEGKLVALNKELPRSYRSIRFAGSYRYCCIACGVV